MKKFILPLSVLVLSVSQAWAMTGCFLVKDQGTVIKSEGDCSSRYSPCSSFKIALALVGYDAGILKDANHPQWPFKEKYAAPLESWKHSQTPATWIQNSCVWYSQVLTSKLGMKRFQDYVNQFDYGNRDVSGDKGQNNGLTHAWLSSSLKISPEEQAIFLEKLLANTLPVSDNAHRMTKKIIYIEDLPEGWALYGKTGSGLLLCADRTQKLDIKHGWFIGWIEKCNKKIIFIHHIIEDTKQPGYLGPIAKEQAKEKLLKLIQQIEHQGMNCQKT